MPVRSSITSVLKWPDREAVERALRPWAAREAERHPGLLALGFFGSYARGDWGPGSDVDLVAIVDSRAESVRPDEAWEVESLPVPAELLTYTPMQWQQLLASHTRLARTLKEETVWIYRR